MQVLHGHPLEKAVLSLNGWHQRGYELVKAFPTATHTEAMLVISEAGRILSESAHTPAVEVRAPGTTVYLAIHTPSQGGVTDKDVEVAERLDHGLRDYVRPTDLMGGQDAPGVHDEMGGPDAPGVGSVLPSDPEAPPGLRQARSDADQLSPWFVGPGP
jgi:4a-hydroxytetrahydrobiopterin dehydratase